MVSFIRGRRGWFGLRWLALLGPGLIAANAGNDAGAVVTYSTDGISYGYDLIWAMVVVTISLIVVQEMAGRMGAVTGKGLSDLIREQFGVRWSVLAMAALFVANGALVASEFAGIAVAGELLGIPRFVIVPVSAALLWLLILRGSYRRVEGVFLVFTFVFLAYPIAAVLAHPDWGEVMRHMVAPHVSLRSGYLFVVIATIGTTITPYMQLYLQSATAEKANASADVPAYKVDVYIGSIFADVIAIFMIIATAATLYVHHANASDASSIAMALRPLAGPYAQLAFSIGLFGASALAAGVLPLATAFVICEAFGSERGVDRRLGEAPVFHGLFTIILVIGALVAMIPGVPLIQALLLAQVLNGLLLPVILVFMLLLVNNPRVMGRRVNGRLNNILGWSTAVIVGALSLLLILITLAGTFGVHLPGMS